MRGVRVRQKEDGFPITVYKLRNMSKKDREALGLPEPLYRHTQKAVEPEYRTEKVKEEGNDINND